jgi:hypothetical protein
MKPFKPSTLGIVLALLYLLLVLLFFVAHLYSVETNPADSGESAIPLYLLALPWMAWVPSAWTSWSEWSWLAYPVLGFCIALNAVLVFTMVSALAFIVSWGWRLMRGFQKR